LAGLIATRVASPIVTLTEKVRRQNLRELGGVAAQASEDEIGLLSQAISSLARDLQTEKDESERAHRRALLAERQLSEKERLAAIGQLAAGLAHELNNPLTVILGAAEVASESRKAPKKWTDAIQKEALRCRNLVSDLLDFSRPLKLRLKQVDLGAVVREAWEHSALGRSQAAKLEMGATKARLRVDPERIKQVFINLFSNAREAGAATVTVNFDAAGVPPRVEVKDDGPGLGKEPEKFFRPFFTTRPSGTGLGLSIARMIVQAHGGRLWAENAKGAHFIMELPKGS
jgi:signal transduction histidine kinase